MNHATPPTETPAGRLWVFALALPSPLNAGRWFQLARLAPRSLLMSSSSARVQAKIHLSNLFKYPEPLLLQYCHRIASRPYR